ncbi:MAG: sulfatase-like hydrolase/transferase [Acidobacteriaceae bacterium]|nr:sulfatase-like hydrolase/transferase [Acidobacteriaceae bacterium]
MNTNLASGIVSVVCCFASAAPLLQAAPAQQRPNILFVIMDDVGIDQLRSFGYGGLTPPSTPVLDLVAQHGIRFRNVWAMPECSPSRAMFFEGRYPLRTNILTAILSTDLANSQVSPFEMTTPKILRTVNYKSALFGKYHLAGPYNNPYGNGTPTNANGFDYFDGFVEGAPHPIDTTAGGVNVTDNSNPALPIGPYTCGFVPNKSDGGTIGSDMGACYFADDRGCKIISASQTTPTPGRSCMEQGGIFLPAELGGGSCSAVPPSNVNFGLTNAYYVFNLVTDDLAAGTVYKHPLTDPRARMYSPTETTDAAVKWIKSQPSGQSWMATASYASIHAPYQQAPQVLTPSQSDLSGLYCSGTNGSLEQTRTISNQMLEALDTEIGRLLIQTGIASQAADGSITYDPSASNTMVIIIGDNGTYAPSVKAPFDLQHAKGFVNQTGVWVPLMVSGPLVSSPDRNVESMVNVADLFQLFGEIAGADVRSAVPSARILDSVSMLPYLTNPSQGSLRSFNFTQTGINITANNVRPYPCVIPVPSASPTCAQIFPQAGLCKQEGGTWYGPDPTTGQGGYASCCAVQAAGIVPNMKVLPLAQAAVRNDDYKLISVTPDTCDAEETPLQLYRISQTPGTPLIDYPSLNLITDQTNPTNGLTPQQAASYTALKQELDAILGSESQCLGDGNQDGVVDQQDITNYFLFSKSGSSWYNFPVFDPVTGSQVYSGITGPQDLQVIQQNLGQTCQPR